MHASFLQPCKHTLSVNRMSSEGLVKDGRKKVVIVGGGAAGMVCYRLLPFLSSIC